MKKPLSTFYIANKEVTGGDKGLQGVTKDYRNFFKLERFQILFLGLFCIKIKVEFISNFLPKRWTNPFGKILIMRFFFSMIFVKKLKFFHLLCFLKNRSRKSVS